MVIQVLLDGLEDPLPRPRMVELVHLQVLMVSIFNPSNV